MGTNGLAVRYKSGVVCFYPGTSEDFYWGLIATPSAGVYIHQYLYHHTYYTL